MHAEMNGKVSVYPTGVPPYVKVYHRLSAIESRLSELKRLHARTSCFDPDGINTLAYKADDVRMQYMVIMAECSGNITGWHSSKDRFYETLRVFLERTASNDHAVMPFFGFILTLRDTADLISRGRQDRDCQSMLGDLQSDWELLGARIAANLKECRSYCCMLSESMGASIAKVSTGRLIAEALEVQKKVSMLRTIDFYCNPEISGNPRVQRKYVVSEIFPREYAGISFKDNYGGTSDSFEPFLHVLSGFLITNALKATVIAHAKQLKNGADAFGKRLAQASGEAAYEKIPLIAAPKVEVSVNEEPGGKFSITVADNGIGMSNQRLFNLLSLKKSSSLFESLTTSGGASMPLIGHLLDFMDGKLEGQSKIGEGTAIKIILPKKLEFN